MCIRDRYKVSDPSKELGSGTNAGDDLQKWYWSCDQSEWMHPFWAVERKTNAEMAALRLKHTTRSLKPQHNVELKDGVHNVVFLCQNGSESLGQVSSSKVLTVPFMTNTEVIQEGEELFLRVADPKEKKKPAATQSWQAERKEAQKAKEQQAQRAAKKQKTVYAIPASAAK